MRNYIILNGNNSNEITGLLIQTLPPISQPKIRTNIEEIDGRDGDIITKLGYSAYDKEISIGLYGNYDVDDIIKYFTDNQSGKVTFSDEPDKYYYYEILDQVDFDKLIRYRTATVTLHCQPFKYSTTETKIQIDATEVSGSGSSITLNNTEDGALFTSLQLNGDTTQKTTTGKNLFNIQTMVKGRLDNGVIGYDSNTTDLTLNSDSFSFTTNTTWRGACSDFIEVNPNTTYTFSSATARSSEWLVLSVLYDDNKDFIQNGSNINVSTNGIKFTTTATTKYIRLSIQKYTAGTLVIEKPQFEIGSTYSDYEPYTNGASPNPDYPQNVDVVTGDNNIVVCGKNISQLVSITTVNGGYINRSNSVMAKIEANKTYTLSFNCKSNISSTANLQLRNYYPDATSLNYETLGNINFSSGNRLSVTMYTPTQDGEITINANFSNVGEISDVLTFIQLEENNQATSYEPYVSQTYDVDLGTIELCKIGDYQDYIYKENGNWYLYKAIGKVVLDGSESWGRYIETSKPVFWVTTDSINIDYKQESGLPCYSNYFQGKGQVSSFDDVYNLGNNVIAFRTTFTRIAIRDDSITSTTDFANWLSSNNVSVYYVLATPTTTQITDDDLITQLEALIGATTYLGQTNIITSGSTLNPLLEVTTFAVDDPSFVITNSGNFKSKPIITIYGLGTIGLYLNGIQVLSLDMGETTSQITIDVAKLEAYNQETGALMNRSVTGDYNNLSLNVGENTITESGTLQGIEIENYSRWL